MDIDSEFEKRKPWISQFAIEGRTYGGGISFDNDIRIEQFFDCFPDSRSILDLGSLEGGQTFQLAKRPGISVLGIEGREANVEKAEYVKGIMDVRNVRFACANLENTPLARYGTFDAVFCSGLLYHLPKPWELIREIGGISKKIFIWTHIAKPEQVVKTINGYSGYDYMEFGLKDPLSGLSPYSFRVSRGSMMDMLINNGFYNIKVYEDNRDHPHGPCITLGAWKN